MTPPFPGATGPLQILLVASQYYAYGTYSENFHHGPEEAVPAGIGQVFECSVIDYATKRQAIIYPNVIGPSVHFPEEVFTDRMKRWRKGSMSYAPPKSKFLRF
jgi:hypothetical protein